MPRKKKKAAAVHTFLVLKVNDYDASVDASINYEVRDRRRLFEDAKVYSFSAGLEIQATCIYPDDRMGDPYKILVRDSEVRNGNFSMTLADCHVRDEEGMPKYRKQRGELVPIYDVPKGIGFVERLRGTRSWIGYIWISSRTVADMMSLLSHAKPLYIDIQEYKVERTRWIISLSLQTTDSSAE